MNNFIKIKNKINQLGYDFFDENIIDIYTNVNEKYHLIDENGYHYYCCLKHLLKEKLPNFVGTSNPYSIQNIIRWIQINNKKYTLLSTNFKSAHDYLELQCNDCGEVFQRNWNNLLNGNGCRKCRYTNQKILQMRPKHNDKLMLSDFKDICMDWDKRNVNPYTIYSARSGKKVLWKCHECGYE